MLTQNPPVDLQQTLPLPPLPLMQQTTSEQRPLQSVQPCSIARVEPAEAAVPHAAAARGLAQVFGLNIRAAILAVLVDLMLFGEDAVTFGTHMPLGICAAAALSFIVYKIQRQDGDDHDSALIKSLIIGLLTAIPSPLTPLIAIPGGIIGVVSYIRGRNQKPTR